MSIISGSVSTGGVGTNAATSTSITAYAVPAGANKRLIVAVHLWTTPAVVPTISSVTHNGVAMTQVALSSSFNANGGVNGATALAVYELILGATTPTGDIVATHQAARPMITALTLQNVVQTGTPTVASSQSLGADTVASTATSDVIDFVCNYAQSVVGNFAVTIGSGQTSLTNRRLFAAIGAESNFAASSANSPGASTTTMQWTGTVSAGPRAQHIVLAWAAAATTATASASATLGPVSGNATATALISAAASVTLRSLGATASSAVLVSATALVALGQIDASALAAALASASALATLGTVAATSTARVAITASGAAKLASFGASATAITAGGTPGTPSRTLALDSRAGLTLGPRAGLTLEVRGALKL